MYAKLKHWVEYRDYPQNQRHKTLSSALSKYFVALKTNNRDLLNLPLFSHVSSILSCIFGGSVAVFAELTEEKKVKKIKDLFLASI